MLNQQEHFRYIKVRPQDAGISFNTFPLLYTSQSPKR